MLRSFFDRLSLPAQMMVGFMVVVFLTTATIGVPSIWLLRQQSDRQAWTQVGQGERAAEAFCTAQQREIIAFATLTAERPTLRQLLLQGDRTGLVNYLLTLQRAADFDLIAVCDTQDQMLAATAAAVPASICAGNRTGSLFIDHSESLPQAWMTGSYPLVSDEQALGHVVVALRLDHAYAVRMRSYTGLENTLLVDGQPIASSFSQDLSTLATLPRQTIPSDPSRGILHTRFDLGGQPYYASNLRLQCMGASVEVALPVADVMVTQKRLAGLLVGEMLVVVVLGSILGTWFSRRISQPLVDLAKTAVEFSKGDLTSPVTVETRVLEQALVAQALESVRVNLLQTVTDLRREKTWTNHVLESIVEGIITLDENKNITFFSHGAEQVTGWRREQVVNHPCDEVFKLEDPAVSFYEVLPVPGTRKRVHVRLADERLATLSISVARLSDPVAGEAKFAIVFRDISQENLVHHLMGVFIANVVHEFRTPLAALNASIELLQDQDAQSNPEERKALLKGVQVSVINLQTLVDNLLESASSEAGHFHVSPRPYDLSDLISEAVHTMQPLLEKYGQRLVVKMPQVIPLVNADPRRTVQVLVNLLANASKYGPADADIILSAHIDDGYVRVKVTDCGPGVPPEQRDSLFRRFTFPGATQAHLKVGAGLGLSVVKSVVEAQGGQAGVDHPPLGGTIFWFSIPIVQEI